MRRFRHPGDRKSTRLNSSHGYISNPVFCLKQKNELDKNIRNFYFFFLKKPATYKITTIPKHDSLPITEKDYENKTDLNFTTNHPPLTCRGWEFTIKDPRDHATPIQTVFLKDEALSTSG